MFGQFFIGIYGAIYFKEHTFHKFAGLAYLEIKQHFQQRVFIVKCLVLNIHLSLVFRQSYTSLFSAAGKKLPETNKLKNDRYLTVKKTHEKLAHGFAKNNKNIYI